MTKGKANETTQTRKDFQNRHLNAQGTCFRSTMCLFCCFCPCSGPSF